jgi:hypothetical protein
VRSSEEKLVVFGDAYFVLGESSGASGVTEFSDGNEGTVGETRDDVSISGLRW